jgi:hypothetical protein
VERFNPLIAYKGFHIHTGGKKPLYMDATYVSSCAAGFVAMNSRETSVQIAVLP